MCCQQESSQHNSGKQISVTSVTDYYMHDGTIDDEQDNLALVEIDVVLSIEEINIGREKLRSDKKPQYVVKFPDEEENSTMLEKEKSLKCKVLLD